jgi:hypothetical protein
MKRKVPYHTVKSLKLQEDLSMLAPELMEGGVVPERKVKRGLLTAGLNRSQMTCLL